MAVIASLDQAAVCEEIRRVLSDINVTGRNGTKKLRAYSVGNVLASEGFPEAIADFPAAVVYVGGTIAFDLLGGGEAEHHWVANIDVMTDGANLAARMGWAAELQMRVIETMTANYAGLMGNPSGTRLVSYIKFMGSEGLQELQWGSATDDLAGFRMRFEVSQSGAMTIGTGA